MARGVNRDVETQASAYDRAQQNAQIIEWRRHGRSYRWIGEQLGMAHQTIYDRYMDLLAAITVPEVEKLRIEALERHEGLMVELRDMAARESQADVPDLDLIRRCLADIGKHTAEIRKLCGLDAPSRVEAKVEERVTYVVEGVDTAALK